MSKSSRDKSQFVLPDPKVTADAADDDRIWFEQHPGETERIRPPFPNELDGIDPNCSLLRVVQIAPGVRMRKPVRFLAGGVL
jgi:hypothetical protein